MVWQEDENSVAPLIYVGSAHVTGRLAKTSHAVAKEITRWVGPLREATPTVLNLAACWKLSCGRGFMIESRPLGQGHWKPSCGRGFMIESRPLEQGLYHRSKIRAHA